MQTYIVGKNQSGQRLDKFLRKYMPEAGSGFLYKMLRKKNITLNNKKADGTELLSIDDQICFYFSDETFAKFVNTKNDTEYLRAFKTLKEISVIFEDNNILILNKPVGVLSQKAKNSDLSLNEWLIGYLLDKKDITEADLASFRPSVVNRLDRNTSGLVLCGKSLSGSQYLSRILKEHTLRKFYRTVVFGKVTKGSRIQGYLIKDSKSNKVSISEESNANNSESFIETAYEPIQIYSSCTLLEVELFTGKTHQIRAHLSSIQHPVIGDSKYGYENINRKYRDRFHLNHQLLHAYRLEFPDDMEAKQFGLNKLVVQAPYSNQFQSILDRLV